MQIDFFAVDFFGYDLMMQNALQLNLKLVKVGEISRELLTWY
jgi:hypothetical protein